jgi:sarcosine oxidase subunit alpha
VVSTTNDSAYDTVADLHAAGIGIAAVVDARPELSPRAAEAAAATGARVLTGSAVTGTAGERRLTGVTVQALDGHGQLTGAPESFDCDLLAVSGGWSPVVHLHSQRQGRLRWDDGLAAFVPDGTVRDQRVAGAARGTRRLPGRRRAGRCAGRDGRRVPGPRPRTAVRRCPGTGPGARTVAGPRTRGRARHVGHPLRRPAA